MFTFPWEEKLSRGFICLWMALFPSSPVSHLSFLVSSFSVGKIEPLSRCGLITGHRKMEIQELVVQLQLHLYVTLMGLCTDWAGMLEAEEHFCPLFPLFKEMDEEKWYKSVV